MSWQAGDNYPAAVSATDADGDPADPASLTLKVRDPSTTVTTYTHPGDDLIVRDALGEFHADVPLTDPGEWVIEWIMPGEVEAVQVSVAPAPSTTIAFATPAELAEHLGATFTAPQTVRARSLLARATGIIQGEARQTIGRVVDDVLTRRGSAESTILLPGRPVEAIESITLDGDALDDYVLDGHEVYRPGGWGSSSMELVVTYTHGHDRIPEALKAICIAAAARVWTNPGNVVMQQLGAAQTTWGQNPAGLLLTKDERQTIRRVLGTGSMSLPLR